MIELDPIVLQLISSIGYAGLFFFVIMGLLLNAFFLYDDAGFLMNTGREDMGWLYILCIPVELCVALVFFRVVVPYVF